VRMQRRMPKLVVLNRNFERLRNACFSVDHAHGGALAARTLIEHGHRTLGVIAGPASAPDNVDRINGFLREIAVHGIAPDSVPIVESNFTPDGGWQAMKRLAEQGLNFTGLFCANDDMAIGALSYLRQSGISVPNDLSVIGYDDVDAAAHAAPTLTSIHVPMGELTANAVRWLLNECYGAERPVVREFPLSISMRASVAPARKKRRATGSTRG
jgi:LacI family transcriptional regulator